MRTRPAAKIAVPVIIGILIGHCCEWSVLFSWLILAGLVILLAVSFKKWQSGRILLCDLFLMVSLVWVGIIRYHQAACNHPWNAIERFANLNKSVTLYGVVVKTPELKADRVRLKVRADSICCDSGQLAVQGHTLVSLKQPPSLPQYGDRISIQGELQLPSGRRNPGEFDYQKYLASQDITTLLYAYNDTNLSILSHGHGHWFLANCVYPLRLFMLKTIDAYLAPEHSAILKGLLVGARSEIPFELTQAFSNTGVAHVLAVSGLHVGFVLLILISITGLVRLPRSGQALVTVIGLILYIFLTEAKAPVVRASVMAIVILLSNFLQRRTDIYNSLSFSALIILLIDPRSLFDPGFQLSFTAVLSIAFLYHRIGQMMKIPFRKLADQENRLTKYLCDLLFISLAAQLGTLPLVAYYFNIVPIVSLLANLLVVPCVGIIVALGFITILCAAIFAPLGMIYANANWLMLSFLLFIVRWGANLPFAYVHFSMSSVLPMVVYYGFLGFIFIRDNNRARKYCLFIGLIGMNIFIWHKNLSDSHALRITFFDVSHGDGALVQFPNKKIMLVDAGDRSEFYDVGERIIAPYLHRNGHRKIDAILVTHAHSDHLGGVLYLMQHFKIGRIIEPGYEGSSSLYRTFKNLADSLQIPIQVVSAGDTLGGFGQVLVLVLNPTPTLTKVLTEDGSEINNSSVVIKILYGETAFLFMGDAEKNAEDSIIQLDSLLTADVIKVGHHGSMTSSSARLINKIKPAFGVVSVGRWNRFHLPSKRRLRELAGKNITICRTDSSGAIIFLSDSHFVRRIEWRQANSIY